MIFRDIVAKKARSLLEQEKSDPEQLEESMKEVRRILLEAGLLLRYPNMTNPDQFVEDAFAENSRLDNQEGYVPLERLRGPETLEELAHALVPHISPD